MKAMLLVFSALTVCASVSFAGPDCTKDPKKKWQNAETFQKDRIAEGYKIKKFKVTSGNCYEIYGWNKEGQKIEIYFNPVDGSKVKEK
ncbi:MAG: PepSY domain-containing protein [Bdellovibrionaceae bacterium]|nr:PepSY domain-containing protein [Pseudobdellovibrionaceae bacterium]